MAVLVNPAYASRMESTLRDAEPAARAMALQIQVHKASTAREIDAVFADFVRERPDALLVASDPVLPAGVCNLPTWRRTARYRLATGRVRLRRLAD